MSEKFDRAFDRLMRLEGGYVNDPRDPGGETKWGISKRAFPSLEIASLTREDARDLYRRELWDKHEMEQIPESVSYQVFDFAVHSGIDTAMRKLQQAVGVADDGYIGPITRAAMALFTPHDLVVRYLATRLLFLTKLKNWKDSGAGWANRIAQDLIYSAEDVN